LRTQGGGRIIFFNLAGIPELMIADWPRHERQFQESPELARFLRLPFSCCRQIRGAESAAPAGLCG
jgi:hypothetical protein